MIERPRLSIEFTLQDMWLGVFWCWKTAYQGTAGIKVRELHVYVCILPCVPIHVIVTTDAKR